MLYGFYFRFIRLTRRKWLSAFLSYMVYAAYFCSYIFKRILYKKRLVNLTVESSLETIKEIYPDPSGRPELKTVEVDNNLDLSIIVPIYNYVNLIENNIQSILNQKTDYKFELILVDDGSTDGAQDIVRKYEDHPDVKVIFQKNQGIAGARNTGLNNACGKYIMFIDCDDTVENNLVDVLLKRAYKDDCDIVMCAHNLVKERSGEIYEVIPNIYPQYNMLRYADDAKILNYAGLPWCKVYKRELWDSIRFLPGYWYEDNIIHSLLFTSCKKFAYEPVVCYQYRWYENNFSHIQNNKVNPKCIDMYWMFVSILEKYDELGLPKDVRFETMLLKHLSAYYYNKISGLDSDVVDALFVLACDLYKKYSENKECKLPYMLKLTRKALIKGDINLWKLAIKYQK